MRALCATIVSVAVVGLGLSVATAANAADITDQIVGEITVTTTDGDTNTWDRLDIHIELDSQGQPVDEGDTFTIEFPDELTVPNETIELMGDGEVMATCIASTGSATEPANITCTMTAAAASRQFVSGELNVSVQVNERATGETFELKAGNEVVVLEYPGGAVGEPWARPYPTDFYKWGWQASDDPSILAWFIAMPSAAFPAGEEIKVTDTLNGDSDLVGVPTVALRTYMSEEAYNNEDYTYSVIPLGTSTVEIAPGYTTDVTLTSINEKSFELSFTNVLPNGALYVAEYRSSVDAELLDGQVVGNSATANGEETSEQISYVDYINGNLNGPGLGGLTLTKFVTGDGADLAAGQSFTAVASWTDAAGVLQTSDLIVVADGAGASLNGIPTGTVVSLNELTTTAIPGVESYTPTFSSEDPAVVITNGGQGADVTIGDRTTVSVVLTNDVTKTPATGKVSVGDYVWEDVNRDGLQDATDVPLEGITLTLTGPDGGPVTDVNGNVVAPVMTDANGFYEFIDLPILQDGQVYTVTISVPEGFEPTVAGAGSDRAVDSSTGFATSISLTQDGQRDPTLDFGFVRESTTPSPTPTPTPPTETPTPSPTPPVVPTTPPTSAPPVVPTPPAPTLPVTGSDVPVWMTFAAFGAIIIGAVGVGTMRKRKES